jgi:hypothetical protein
LICYFVLPRRIDDARFHKIKGFNPRCHAHYLRVCSETELNGDVARWLTEAYAVGRQKRKSKKNEKSGPLHRPTLTEGSK